MSSSGGRDFLENIFPEINIETPNFEHQLGS
jgi:hypothetical protein